MAFEAHVLNLLCCILFPMLNDFFDFFLIVTYLIVKIVQQLFATSVYIMRFVILYIFNHFNIIIISTVVCEYENIDYVKPILLFFE